MLVKTDLSRRYLELLKRSLLNNLYIENEAQLVNVFLCMKDGRVPQFSEFYHFARDQPLINKLRQNKADGSSLVISRREPDGSITHFDETRNVTELSHTMIGRARLDNLQDCMETCLSENVLGDFVETGIWRGGACILMRGVLAAYDVNDRLVWAADSFEGVPPPTYGEDIGLDLSKEVLPVLAVPQSEVEELFRRYGLLDDSVRFLKGWFKDTLPAAPIWKIAVLRLDGDLYESTMDALNALYDRVSVGGFVIVDDYYSCPPCGQAVDEFRSTHNIATPLKIIDAQSVYWRKE